MNKITNIETGTQQLLAKIDHNVGIITLNRPEARNALSDELTPALRKTLKEFNESNIVRSLMITGSGESFCAGGDITALYKGGKGEGDSNVLSEFPASEYLLDYAMTTMEPF